MTSSIDKKNTADKSTGIYKYDKTLKKVVKVSADIPGLKKGGSADKAGHRCCGGCCGGSCPMQD